jgi:5-formyltetrahydrofolate cyclo-ligase
MKSQLSASDDHIGKDHVQKKQVQADKQRARIAALAIRSELSAEQCLEAGTSLANRVLHSSLITTANTVAAYVSMGTEISTFPLLATLLSQQKRVLVPRLGAGRDVLWGVLDDVATMHNMGSHRPQEPETDLLPPESVQGAEVIFVPALAVDSSGNRLGRGAAWYDEALTHRRKTALTVAVCWPWEFRSDVVPSQDHDVRMDAVLTPESFTLLASNKSYDKK